MKHLIHMVILVEGDANNVLDRIDEAMEDLDAEDWLYEVEAAPALLSEGVDLQRHVQSEIIRGDDSLH